MLALVLGACGEEESDQSAAPSGENAEINGEGAPRKISGGGGPEASRFELEAPLEAEIDRVDCPTGVHLGDGARFTCRYSDPELGTGVLLVEQSGESGELEYRTLPRASVEFEGSYEVDP